MLDIAGGILLAVGALVLGGLLLVNWRVAGFLLCAAVVLVVLFLPR